MSRNRSIGWGIVAGVWMATAAGWAADPAPPAAPDGGPMPMIFAPVAGTNGPGQAAPFSAEISADFIKKVMETSAKIEAAKRAIADRQAQLFETHPEIKAHREQMKALQAEINAILGNDPEWKDLSMRRDIVWSVMPVLPRLREPGAAPGFLAPFGR